MIVVDNYAVTNSVMTMNDISVMHCTAICATC